MNLTLDEIMTLLAEGKASAWRDKEGNSLLHHAARLGDMEAVELSLAQGISALVYNKELESARDMARSWGHDAAALRLDQEMRRERAAAPAAALPYKTLADIRAKKAFYDLAKRGLFDQVIALAEKDSGNLCADDLLSAGADGDMVLMHVCQQGQLSLLLRPELWAQNPADLSAIWEKTPKIYQEGLDAKPVLLRANQLRLRNLSAKAGPR